MIFHQLLDAVSANCISFQFCLLTVNTRHRLSPVMTSGEFHARRYTIGCRSAMTAYW